VIDLGRAYNLNTELDIGADAYALARATQIDRDGQDADQHATHHSDRDRDPTTASVSPGEQ